MSKIGFKILKMVIAVLLVSFIIIALSTDIIFKSIFLKLQGDAKEFIGKAQSCVDINKLDKVIQSGSMDSVEYKEIQDSMIKFKNDNSIRYIYTMIKGDENSACILVDGALGNSSSIGEKYNIEDEMVDAFNGKVSVSKKPVSDNDGTFISAYAPLKNSSGDIVAIIGADVDVTTFLYIKGKILMCILTAACASLIVSLIICIIYSKKLTSNVVKINENLSKMSTGDLTSELSINSRDEIQSIAESIDAVRVKTCETIRIIKDTSNNVTSNAEALSTVSGEMASSTESVATAIEYVTKGTVSQSEQLMDINVFVNNFSEKLDLVIEAISQVSQKVAGINSKATLSSEDLKAFEISIKDIKLLFNDITAKIKGLDVNISQINEITNLINNIANQTNLLALNAAIEAARAGESGRGFSVVAEEIRKLAEQSKESSLNINSILEKVSSESDLVVKTSESMDGKLNEQLKIINKSVNSFKDIIEDIEDVMPKMDRISCDIRDINSEKEKIETNVESISASSEEISASSEEISASSREINSFAENVASSSHQLNNLAQSMMNAVNQFKVE